MGQWNGPLGDVEVIQWLGNRTAVQLWADGHGVGDGLTWGADSEDGTPSIELNVASGSRADEAHDGTVKHGDFLVLMTDRTNPDEPVVKLMSVPKEEFVGTYKPRQPSGGV